MSRRVVVTGMGVITPVGLNVDDLFQSIKEGKHGFGPITRFDSSGYKCHVAAQVEGFDAILRRFSLNFSFRENQKRELFGEKPGDFKSVLQIKSTQ